MERRVDRATGGRCFRFRSIALLQSASVSRESNPTRVLLLAACIYARVCVRAHVQRRDLKP